MSEEAWKVLQSAKSKAWAEKAREITPLHVLAGLAQEQPGLIEETLERMRIPAPEARKAVERLKPPRGADLPTESLPLSREANEIVQVRARRLARDHPASADARVTPVHLWVGLCECAWPLQQWWKESRWDCSAERLEQFLKAAKERLPSFKPAYQPLPDGAVRVLKKYCRRNLTELAAQGRLTPAIGVKDLCERLTDCLLRMNNRSVVLTGPAGAGKTKLVEHLALKIAQGEIPQLAGCQVFELDLVLFTRGTHLAGSQAERWAELTDVLRQHPDQIILFIDELHTIVGVHMGGEAMTLANALKPLMVDDRVRLIGATTWDEYSRYIQGDSALERRFTELSVPEPDRNTMLGILHGVSRDFEAYYGIKFTSEALEAIYELARWHQPNRSFPSKAIDLLDEVGVWVSRRRPPEAFDSQATSEVRANDVREVLKRKGIEEFAGVDVAALLKEEVIGQDRAAEMLANAVVTARFRYGQGERRGPRAVILFLGPPGVGKSYMAQVFSEILFPGRDSLLVLDMTEFSGPQSGEHARFRLLGPAPPYVGWEQGGLLTRHAREHPVSVVLIEEFDKACPEARNILLRVLEEGLAQDGRGRVVSFRGMYFILTANAAQDLWKEDARIGFAPAVSASADSAPEFSEPVIRDVLRREGFAPELLSRISHIVLFRSLTEDDLCQIARLRLSRLREQALIEDYLLLEYDEQTLARWVVEQSAPPRDSRRVAAAFERWVETPLAWWRMRARPGQIPVLRLEPEAGRLRIVECAIAWDEVQKILLQRITELYRLREGRTRLRAAARIRLGTMG